MFQGKKSDLDQLFEMLFCVLDILNKLPGAEVVLVRAYLGLKDYEEAKKFANSAYEKAEGMKYRWAEIKAGSLPKTCRDSGCGGFVGGDILGQG